MDMHLTIGGVARLAGVNVETIRYYERRGLVAQPAKPPGGQRHYPASTADRVRFIKRAQQLGFTLDEVQGLLSLDDGQNCRDARQLAERRLALIETRIADLSRMRRVLRDVIAECARGAQRGPCPIIATLSAPGGGAGGTSPLDVR